MTKQKPKTTEKMVVIDAAGIHSEFPLKLWPKLGSCVVAMIQAESDHQRIEESVDD